MTKLITTPNFLFTQIIEELVEYPIHVIYWDGTIELKQNDKSILIEEVLLNKLFNEIKTHLPKAKKHLNND